MTATNHSLPAWRTINEADYQSLKQAAETLARLYEGEVVNGFMLLPVETDSSFHVPDLENIDWAIPE